LFIKGGDNCKAYGMLSYAHFELLIIPSGTMQSQLFLYQDMVVSFNHDTRESLRQK